MKEIVKRRKNFLPTLIITLVFWGIWLWVLLRLPPETILSLLVFYFSLFLALFLSTALILANSRRGLLIALAVIAFLFLKQLRLASILNVALLICSLASLEIYLSRH